MNKSEWEYELIARQSAGGFKAVKEGSFNCDDSAEGLLSLLEGLGRYGWEVVASQGETLILKRPKREE